MESTLGKERLAEITRMLLDRQRQLRTEIGQALLKSDDEQYIELAGQVHDLEEASVADLLVDLNYAVVDQHLAELREVESALKRIREGSYGVCADCHEPIAADRLLACPEAKRCLVCQQQHERTYRQPGMPKL